uniref:Uncharacterized protein n=1 Tax=Panagrolaimus superbus TaxID=310955 RepID=A0A914YKY4_9BILA
MDSEADVAIIADETLHENGITINNHSEGALINNRLADRVVSMSNLKEAATVFSPPTTSTTVPSESQPNEAKTVILLLQIIAVLLFLIFISNIWFSISNRPIAIPSGPSASSLEELAELRKLVVSLESKFNSFLTGAKKEL